MRCCGCLENLIWILRRRVYGRIELDSRGKMEIKACEMSLEQWMGPWNDIEGNVPHTAQLQAFIFQLSQRIHYNFFFSVCVFVLDFILKCFLLSFHILEMFALIKFLTQILTLAEVAENVFYCHYSLKKRKFKSNLPSNWTRFSLVEFF